YDAFLDRHAEHWLAREIRLKWKRVLRRIDLTARSLVALIEPGSCFAGTLAEIVLAADRSYMLIDRKDGDNRPGAAIMLGDVNLRFGGPETMETKIFARLSAWQNWIFQRPNATGEGGALGSYGTGRKPQFDTGRT